MRFFSPATLPTAIATLEVGTSTIMSTPSVSYHSRALVAPTSGLFWWSADTISIGLPSTLPPNSCAAICAATREPGPPMSAYTPDMSFMTPIFTLSPEIAPALAAAGFAPWPTATFATMPSSAVPTNVATTLVGTALLGMVANVAVGQGAKPAAAKAGAISGDKVKIGVMNDMSGVYADIGGPGSLVAAQMAAQEFGGKVLGKPIEIVSADHQNKPDVGATKAREWY